MLFLEDCQAIAKRLNINPPTPDSDAPVFLNDLFMALIDRIEAIEFNAQKQAVKIQASDQRGRFS